MVSEIKRVYEDLDNDYNNMLSKANDKISKLLKEKNRIVSEREDLLASNIYQDKLIKKALKCIDSREWENPEDCMNKVYDILSSRYTTNDTDYIEEHISNQVIAEMLRQTIERNNNNE